ncbi:hypothetical protein N7474_007112 [Penicillium riverlandense]|uniref:uncharacterized protein n=1 Tax=Penicillium riverlandense TaxID=1903569 RepID=UPI002547A3ED|nr:uncharacterized protein N7474_007112 [Penicillium riverlandense]KAJ5815335.1 hypothetical protein N7474_007112 [Penicillium riverlandense]
MDAAATASSLAAIATTTLLAATTTSSPSSQPHKIFLHGSGSEGSPGQDGDEKGECRLLGPFSLFVQVALGALALLSLVYKRWRERPQRPVKVWAFDVSKQVFGSAMLHLANLLMSLFSAGQLELQTHFKPNPCSFYLLNLGIDTTLGIVILIAILHVLNYVASYTPLANPPESIQSGNYGHPPRAWWWFKQSIIYFLGLLGMKICVFFLIQLVPWVIKVGDWALRWTEGNTGVQIFFVMLLFPVIMNAIQYYLIDIFIKKPLSYDIYAEDDEQDPIEDDTHRSALLAGIDEDYSSDSGDEMPRKSAETASQPKLTPPAIQEAEGQLTEDHSPVPPYELPYSSDSQRKYSGEADATHHH